MTFDVIFHYYTIGMHDMVNCNWRKMLQILHRWILVTLVSFRLITTTNEIQACIVQ